MNFIQIFIKEGFPITEAHYYANINEQELRHILRSDSNVQIPLLEQRLKVLQETGKILLEEFQGSFLNCIKMANGSAKYLLKIITDYFPSYRDEQFYLKRKGELQNLYLLIFIFIKFNLNPNTIIYCVKLHFTNAHKY